MALINILLAYVIIAPLLGCILLEYFEFYSYSSGQIGYYNGSWIVYLANSILLLFIASFVSKLKLTDKTLIIRKFRYYYSKSQIKSQTKKIIILSIIFLLMMLFLFQGYKTLLGTVNKGEFRSKTLGVAGLGFLAYMIFKFFIPTILAYLMFIHKYLYKQKKYVIYLAFFLSMFSGFLWGFKSSSIIIILPALMVMFQKFEIKHLFKLVLLFFIVVIIAGYFFDREIVSSYNLSIFEFIFLRMTVIEGDTYWTIFGKIINNEIQPLYFDYFKYLLNFFGNKINSFFIDLSNPINVLNYKFASYINYVTFGDLYYATSGEHNVTATYVGEGLLFLGFPGVFLFTFLAGIIVGTNIKVFRKSLILKNGKLAAISASCFVMLTWSWLKGGDITTIFHISNLIGIILSSILLNMIEKRIIISRGLTYK
jgi:hypothetical protein